MKAPLNMTAEDHHKIGGTANQLMETNPYKRLIDLLDEERIIQHLETTYGGKDGLDYFSADQFRQGGTPRLFLKNYVADLSLLQKEAKLPEQYKGQQEKYQKILNSLSPAFNLNL